MGDVGWRLELPEGLCPSKKNRMRIARVGGGANARPILVKDSVVRKAEVGIREKARVLGGFPKEAELEMRVLWDVVRGVVTVELEEVSRLPARPRKKTGRVRDVINMPAVIADALEGLAYVDDAQIRRLVVERVTGG